MRALLDKSIDLLDIFGCFRYVFFEVRMINFRALHIVDSFRFERLPSEALRGLDLISTECCNPVLDPW